MDIRGKQVVVTGGSRGLGLGLVEALVDKGALVTAVARGEADLRSARERLGISIASADANLFFTFYAKSPPHRVAAAWLDGREVIAVYDRPTAEPSHFMWLEWRDGLISLIRDYRYVPYVVTEAELIEVGTP